MTFDFDTPPDRQGTDSQKWQKYAGRDVLPLWVADMDFRSPPPSSRRYTGGWTTGSMVMPAR